jgi:exopolyphosphatase/guanosine-5'-triphosphate,3'-diphosphate pyrophosphatase
MMTRVGAIDCGTNSIRLLVADIDPDTGASTDVHRQMEVVRLGYGVDRTGRLDPAAIARTLTRAAGYRDTCRRLGVERVRFVATSASRDAENAAEFVDGVRAIFTDYAIEPEVVSGAEEAALSFRGATVDVSAAGFGGPYLVVDLGGGSTEFVRGTAGVEAARSLDIGCVRMTERHLVSDPPTETEIAAATADIDAAIAVAEAEVGFTGIRTLVGLAGSITTVTAHALSLAAYDPAVIHLANLTPAQIGESTAALLAATRAERAAMGFMHPGRVDVIGAGALVWQRIVARVADVAAPRAIVTSEHDILDGIALSLVRP